ncbi:hypothetical protein M3Y99_00666200 [Aphelenchoides fujianensis]|nr:hypothetical protein M3Y99_00666200 [Aphelenchoides fujianensis]
MVDPKVAFLLISTFFPPISAAPSNRAKFQEVFGRSAAFWTRTSADCRRLDVSRRSGVLRLGLRRRGVDDGRNIRHVVHRCIRLPRASNCACRDLECERQEPVRPPPIVPPPGLTSEGIASSAASDRRPLVVAEATRTIDPPPPYEQAALQPVAAAIERAPPPRYSDVP